jgi:hypothetical protein
LSTTIWIKTTGGTKSSDILKKVRVYTNQFENKFADKLIYFYGVNGTQKTHVGWWIAKTLVLKGISVKYVLMDKLVRDITHLEQGTIAREQYMSKDLLIIDESMDATKMTVYRSGWQIPFLDSFIRERCDLNNKAVIFISNVRPEDIDVDVFQISIKDYLLRKTKLTKSLFTFEDNYAESVADFEIEDLWSRNGKQVHKQGHQMMEDQKREHIREEL